MKKNEIKTNNMKNKWKKTKLRIKGKIKGKKVKSKRKVG